MDSDEEYQVEALEDEFLDPALSDEENEVIPPKVPKVFKSNRLKNNKLSLDGHIYVLNSRSNDAHYWICDLYQSIRCNSRLITTIQNDGSHQIRKQTPHLHSPSIQRVLVEQAKTKIREEAVKDVHGKPSQVVDKIASSELVRSNNIALLMGSTDSQRQIARRAKKKSLAIKYPPGPTHISFDYDAEFEDLYLDGEILILRDFEDGSGGRVTIFTTRKLFEHLCNANLWIIDGTFQTTPKPFYQILIIHGNIPGFEDYFTVPMVWCLMSGKSQFLYEQTFLAIRGIAVERRLQIQVQFSMCDFEIAIRNAFKLVFPNVREGACYFHFKQLQIGHLKALKLYKEHYQTSSTFVTQFNWIIALAFLPPDEIDAVLNDLYDSLMDEIKVFADKFIALYIRKPDGRPTLSPPEFWSIYEFIQHGLPKTQCGAEQSHHSLFISCNKEKHLSLYKMITILKQQMIRSEENIEKSIAGIPWRKRDKKAELKEAEIMNTLAKRFEPHITPLQTIKNIGLRLSAINHLNIELPS